MFLNPASLQYGAPSFPIATVISLIWIESDGKYSLKAAEIESKCVCPYLHCLCSGISSGQCSTVLACENIVLCLQHALDSPDSR